MSNIPKYSVIFKTKLFSGTGDYIEVLIPNFDKKINSQGKKELFKAILDYEKSISGSFYLTEEAQKANSSDSFRKSHPNALKDGYLGDITEKGELLE